MDIIIVGILIAGMLVMSYMNRYYALLGVVAGIGMLMIALSVQTSGLQVQYGFNETINTALDMTTNVPNYIDIDVLWSGLGWLKDLLSIVLGGVGLLILISSAISAWKGDGGE